MTMPLAPIGRHRHNGLMSLSATPPLDPAQGEPTSAPAPARSKRHEILEGVRITAPVALGYVPLGIAYGLLISQTSLPPWIGVALNIAAFSGSAELLLVSLIASATPIASIAVTIFLVNSRYLFYAFSFPISLVRTKLGRFYSAYALVDEAYALSLSRPGWTHTRILTMQLFLQGLWMCSGLTGLTLGSLIPASIKGFDFALVAMFIALTLEAARSLSDIPSVLLASLALTLAWFIAPSQWLITSLLIFVGLLAARFVWLRARGDLPLLDEEHSPADEDLSLLDEAPSPAHADEGLAPASADEGLHPLEEDGDADSQSDTEGAESCADGNEGASQACADGDRVASPLGEDNVPSPARADGVESVEGEPEVRS